jgi:hypothetical protein
MDSDALLHNIDIYTHDEYVQHCREQLRLDFQNLFENTNAYITLNSGGQDHHQIIKILAQDIHDNIMSQITCKSECSTDNGEGGNKCEECQYLTHVRSTIKNIRDTNCSYNRYVDPIYNEYWASFYPNINRIFSSDAIYCTNDQQKSYTFFDDDLQKKALLFRTMAKIYSDYIEKYSRNIDSDLTKVDNLMSYLLTKDFMDRYASIITDVVIYIQTYKYYGVLKSNFKRWSRLDSSFKVWITKYNGVTLVNGIVNFIKRKEDVLETQMFENTLNTIIISYVDVKRGIINDDDIISNYGSVGFIISCRLRMPSLIDVFRAYVYDECIEQLLDPDKLRESKMHTIKRLTTKKIVKFLK